MSLTNLHVSGNYQNELHEFLVKAEGFLDLPYFDTATPRLVTIGIGFNIDTVSKNIGYVLAELGIDERLSESDTTRTANQIFKSVMDGVSDGDVSTLILRMNNALHEHFPSLYGTGAEFKLTKPQAYNVLDKILQDKKLGQNGERSLDTHLANAGINVAALQGTQEYLVLTSLNYNTKPGKKDLLGPRLLAAIANDDRAEAWYQIRYDSNGNQQAGIAMITTVCSPDGVQRNPGIGAAAEHFPRIPLRCMRATSGVFL